MHSNSTEDNTTKVSLMQRIVAVVLCPKNARRKRRSSRNFVEDILPQKELLTCRGKSLDVRVEKLYEEFRRLNANCYWNAHLQESIRQLKLAGFLAPATLLLAGRDIYMDTLKSAWSRRVVRAPKDFSISHIGEMRSLSISVSTESPYTPLSEALCFVIGQLQLGDRASPGAPFDAIVRMLPRLFERIHQPPDSVVYEALGNLMAERKIFHTGSGYHIVCPQASHLLLDPSRLAAGQRHLISADSSLEPPSQGPPSQGLVEDPPEVYIDGEAVIRDDRPVIHLHTPELVYDDLPKPFRRRSFSLEHSRLSPDVDERASQSRRSRHVSRSKDLQETARRSLVRSSSLYAPSRRRSRQHPRTEPTTNIAEPESIAKVTPQGKVKDAKMSLFRKLFRRGNRRSVEAEPDVIIYPPPPPPPSHEDYSWYERTRRLRKRRRSRNDRDMKEMPPEIESQNSAEENSGEFKSLVTTRAEVNAPIVAGPGKLRLTAEAETRLRQKMSNLVLEAHHSGRNYEPGNEFDAGENSGHSIELASDSAQDSAPYDGRVMRRFLASDERQPSCLYPHIFCASVPGDPGERQVRSAPCAVDADCNETDDVKSSAERVLTCGISTSSPVACLPVTMPSEASYRLAHHEDSGFHSPKLEHSSSPPSSSTEPSTVIRANHENTYESIISTPRRQLNSPNITKHPNSPVPESKYLDMTEAHAVKTSSANVANCNGLHDDDKCQGLTEKRGNGKAKLSSLRTTHNNLFFPTSTSSPHCDGIISSRFYDSLRRHHSRNSRRHKTDMEDMKLVGVL